MYRLNIFCEVILWAEEGTEMLGFFPWCYWVSSAVVLAVLAAKHLNKTCGIEAPVVVWEETWHRRHLATAIGTSYSVTGVPALWVSPRHLAATRGRSSNETGPDDQVLWARFVL